MILRILFLAISAFGVLAALGTVLSRNLVRAAVMLVGFFFLIACQFVLLEAEFMAVIQVLIYIGAVAVLLLFGIMLTRNIQGDETTGGNRPGKVAGGVAALAVLAVLVAGVRDEKGLGRRPGWSRVVARPTPTADLRAGAIDNMSRTVGVEMMTRYVVGFELAGLLLTAAVVGAIALAMGEQDEAGAATAPGTSVPARPGAPEGPGRGDRAPVPSTAPTASVSP